MYTQPQRINPPFGLDSRMILDSATKLAAQRRDPLLNTAHFVLAATHHFHGPYNGYPPEGLRNWVSIKVCHELEVGTYDYSTWSSRIYAALQGAQLRAASKRYRVVPLHMVLEEMLCGTHDQCAAQELLARLDIPISDLTSGR